MRRQGTLPTPIGSRHEVTPEAGAEITLDIPIRFLLGFLPFRRRERQMTHDRIARLRAERNRIADRLLGDTQGWYTGERARSMVRHIDILDRRIAALQGSAR